MAESRSRAIIPGMPRINTNLSIRERRLWQNRLIGRMEAAERAVEAIEDECLAAYEAGMAYAMVGGIVGVHPTTTKDMCDRALARRDSGSESSQ